MGEIAGCQVGEVGGGQALEEEARAPGADQQLAGFAGGLKADLRAFRQFAHDVVDDMRRRGGRAGLGDIGRGRFGRFEVEIGAFQRQLAVARLDQHVGEDRDGVAPLDDAMDVAQSLQQGRALYGDLHRNILDLRTRRRRRAARPPSPRRGRARLSRGARTLPRRRAPRKGASVAVPSQSPTGAGASTGLTSP